MPETSTFGIDQQCPPSELLSRIERQDGAKPVTRMALVETFPPGCMASRALATTPCLYCRRPGGVDDELLAALPLGLRHEARDDVVAAPGANGRPIALAWSAKRGRRRAAAAAATAQEQASRQGSA